MLKLDYVVIDFEGFKHKNEPYLIKEISVFGPSYQDTLLLKPQCHIDQVPAERRRTYLWCSKHLHGLDWNSGTHDYSFIYQFFTSLKIRFPNAVFYAKGEAKCSYLRSHLFNTVDLELVGCPKVTEFVNFENTICTNHIHPDYYFDHCSKKKAYLFYCWLLNQINKNGCVTLQSSSSPTTSLPESDTDHANNRSSNGSGR